jgi:2-aminoadipate transaminase
VSLSDDGIDTHELERLLKLKEPKFFYAIPNFQNPTGLSYSLSKKRAVSDMINNSNTLLVEDDPYGEIKFKDEENHPIKKHLGHKGILLGSFSKIISPGMRLGWIVAAPEIIEKLLIVKQAADLHSSFLSQRVIYQYLLDNDIDYHINGIINIYQSQKEHMIACLKTYLPPEIKYTNPDGGMFIWMTLPGPISAYRLLEFASMQKVVFVPGDVFYTDIKNTNTLRLNYSNSNFTEIEKGISILGTILKKLI